MRGETDDANTSKLMEILLETENEQTAIALMNEILDDVSGKLVETWHHCLRTVKDKPECSCIYHYTEQDYNDDNKRVKFYVHTLGSRVCLHQIWRQGHTPGRQTKLYLMSTLMHLLIMRYAGKFSAVHFQW